MSTNQRRSVGVEPLVELVGLGYNFRVEFFLSFFPPLFLCDKNISAQHDTQTCTTTFIHYYIVLLHYIILYCVIIMLDALLGLQAF